MDLKIHSVTSESLRWLKVVTRDLRGKKEGGFGEVALP